MITINIILAIVGFVVGTAVGVAVFALVVGGERGETYRLMASRHPWIRLVPILWIVACGALVAYLAYELTG